MAVAVSPTSIREPSSPNWSSTILTKAFCRGHMSTSTFKSFPSDPDILIIPSQALLLRADGKQVARIDSQNRVHLQNVSLGHNLGLDVQITAGLKATRQDRRGNPSLELLSRASRSRSYRRQRAMNRARPSEASLKMKSSPPPRPFAGERPG